MVIFHSYVSLPEGNKNKLGHLVNPITGHEGSGKRAPMMGMKCMCDVTHDVFFWVPEVMLDRNPRRLRDLTKRFFCCTHPSI